MSAANGGVSPGVVISDPYEGSKAAASRVLGAIGVELHVLRRDQAHGMAEPDQSPRPVVDVGARLHADNAARSPRDSPRQSMALPEHNAAGHIDTMHPADGLGEVEADRGEGHGEAPLKPWQSCTLPHPDLERGRST